jgi:hypothetical protein
VRAVHEPAETAEAGELLFAGGRGVGVEGLRDVHEVAWDGERLACVSTLTNEVLWVDRNGDVQHRWRAPGEGDCWHLSGISSAPNGVLVTAFGRFEAHRDWAEAMRAGRGFVLEIPSGRVRASGLTSPHSPRLIDDVLAVCDSGREALLVGSRRVELGGWTRGLAVSETHLVVGVSASRGRAGQAQLVLLRRSDFSITSRIPLPVREVFDVAEAEPEAARALAAGRATPERSVPLGLRDLRCAVEASSVLELGAHTLTTVRCAVTNLGSAVLAGWPPHPVSLVAAWEPRARALWSPLVRPIEPGGREVLPVRVLAPSRPGEFELVLRLAQVGVAWLDGEARVRVTVT